MDITNRIIKNIIDGFESLSNSLYNHWPLPDEDKKNEISEANLVVHFLSTFLKGEDADQNYVFSEYRFEKNKHLDCKIIPKHKEYEIIGEVKRYFSTGVASISRDILRLANIPAYDGRGLYGVILSMTQKKQIADWWENESRPDYPSGRHTSSEWPRLANLLSEYDIICGSIPIGYHGEDGFYHKGIYGVFKIK